MPECSCPICPLTKANVQVCDVVYEELSNKKFGLYCSEEMRQFHEEFNTLVSLAKRDNTPIGSNWSHNDATYKCDIKRIAEKIYKICFHTLADKESDEEDEDEDITCDQCEKKFPEKDTTIVRGWDWCPDCVKGGKSEPLAMD